MGKWGRHCAECSPSPQLEGLFANIVACTSDAWNFETIDESGHNRNLGGRTADGSWFIGVYRDTTEMENTLLLLTIARNKVEIADTNPDAYEWSYSVRVKADHNRCAFNWRCHKKEYQYPEQLNTIRDTFVDKWSQIEPFNTMKPSNRAGGESVTILASKFEFFEDAGDKLLDIIDALDSIE